MRCSAHSSQMPPPPGQRRVFLTPWGTSSRSQSWNSLHLQESLPIGPVAAAAAGAAGAEAITAVVGNTAMSAADPTLPRKIVNVINGAYDRQVPAALRLRGCAALHLRLHQACLFFRVLTVPNAPVQRIDTDDVIDRLEMGDPEPRANRVLHLAWRGGTGPGQAGSELVRAAAAAHCHSCIHLGEGMDAIGWGRVLAR